MKTIGVASETLLMIKNVVGLSLPGPLPGVFGLDELWMKAFTESLLIAPVFLLMTSEWKPSQWDIGVASETLAGITADPHFLRLFAPNAPR